MVPGLAENIQDTSAAILWWWQHLEPRVHGGDQEVEQRYQILNTQGSAV